jgi:hypothetical protein
MHNRDRRSVQELKFSKPKENGFTCVHFSVFPITLDQAYKRNSGVGSRGFAEILIYVL